jgi:hypothetical protein
MKTPAFLLLAVTKGHTGTTRINTGVCPLQHPCAPIVAEVGTTRINSELCPCDRLLPEKRGHSAF